MRKVLIAAAAASVAALVAMPAAAQGWYVEANVGPNFSGKAKVEADGESANIKLKNGWILTGVVGRDLGNGLAIEGEGILSRNKMRAITLPDDSEVFGGARVTTAAALVNVVYTAPLGMVSPYIGAGIGYGDSSVDENAEFDDASGLVWQAKGGAKIALSPKASVNAGIRYVEGARIKEDGVKITPKQTAVTVGVHYAF